jgi:hypothetical protein
MNAPSRLYCVGQEKLDRFIAKPDEVVPGNNMKPHGGLTSAEGPCQGDYILGVAHYQLSGYVTFPIPEKGSQPHITVRVPHR